MRYSMLLTVFFIFCSKHINAGDMLLNGASLHRDFNQDFFLVALWTEEYTTDVDDLADTATSKRIELCLLTDEWTPSQFQKKWLNDFSINNDLNHGDPSARYALAFIETPRSSLKFGDRVVVEYNAEFGTSVLMNGQTVLSAPDIGLFIYFSNALVGKFPSSRKFKEQLMAGGKFNSEMLGYRDRLNNISVLEGRENIASSWMVNQTYTAINQAKRRTPSSLLLNREYDVQGVTAIKAHISKGAEKLMALSRLADELRRRSID